MSGISSKSDITELSGRGVGMGAVAEACRNLGGSIDVVSKAGSGTTVCFRFPTGEVVYEGHSALLAANEAA